MHYNCMHTRGQRPGPRGRPPGRQVQAWGSSGAIKLAIPEIVDPRGRRVTYMYTCVHNY